MRRAVIKTRPGVMEWAVETSGLEAGQIAKRLGVPESAVRGWMRESHEISVAKLEALSDYIKRPLAVFMLADPPDREMPPDYRPPDARITQKTALAIRLAYYLQEAAGRMMRLHGQDASPNTRTDLTVRRSPERAASRERLRLDLDGGQRDTGSRDRERKLYDMLRDAVESMNVHVFQASASPGEMRGLSLSGARPCVILINSQDPPAAKRFTLMHEYGHVLLQKSGLCAPRVRAKSAAPEPSVESWCNRFAAFVLMPRAEFCGEYEKLKAAGADSQTTIARLSRQFATSKLATAVHARDLGLGTQGAVDAVLRNTGAPPRKGGRSTPAARCMSGRGRRFVSLVLASRRAGLISGRDALHYLDMDPARAGELARLA